MTRDEIYDHLAQVYLGKRNNATKEKKPKFNSWLIVNIVITAVILATAFYGLTAFLVHRESHWKNNVIFALNNTPIRIKYDLTPPYPQVKNFSLTIPNMDVTKYQALRFSIRGLEEGYPGLVKIVLKNRKNEVAVYFVRNVRLKWQEVVIPLSEFEEISDWTNVTDVSFVLEAWNAEKKKGIVLIDNVCFSS